jgi:prepilin-type processing-associated H-X9-DG protein
MGRIDGAGSHPRGAPCVKRSANSAQSKAWLNAGATLWQSNGWRRNRKSAGVFYADGHVRGYHGKLTDLSRRHIARDRLCLRGTIDYWVNAMDGRPFFGRDSGFIGSRVEETEAHQSQVSEFSKTFVKSALKLRDTRMVDL